MNRLTNLHINVSQTLHFQHVGNIMKTSMFENYGHFELSHFKQSSALYDIGCNINCTYNLVETLWLKGALGMYRVLHGGITDTIC